MSNLLVVKLGSLGDVVQISGVLKDIKKHHNQDKIFLLTTQPYKTLFQKCPYINEVLIDERKPRWNLFYLKKLINLIKPLHFIKCYDLQNSSRTNFYKKIFGISEWSSSRTTLKDHETKKEFDQDSVLSRFKTQLERSGIINTENVLKPDISWAIDAAFQVPEKKYIYISPSSSAKLKHKRWPYYKELVNLIKKQFPSYLLVTAPGRNEIESCRQIGLDIILDNEKPTNLLQLAKIIKNSHYVISNDTGPAHMAAHLGCNGVVLFGYHTSPKKVSIEREKFKAITSSDLKKLSANEVFDKIKFDLQ